MINGSITVHYELLMELIDNKIGASAYIEEVNKISSDKVHTLDDALRLSQISVDKFTIETENHYNFLLSRGWTKEPNSDIIIDQKIHELNAKRDRFEERMISLKRAVKYLKNNNK